MQLSDKYLKAPLVLFVYNRPEHTRRTISALAQNNGSADSEIIIYSDGAKTSADLEKVKQVRRICREIKGFSSVIVTERESNLGLSGNIITGVSEIINKYGSIIVVEDDIETAPGFLDFMNTSLIFYKGTDIFSISGYSPNIVLPKDYPFITFTAPRISSWGWATWKEKWNLVDWELEDFNAFISSKRKRKLFNMGGNDLSGMLLKQYKDQINSWAVRFNYARFKRNNRVIYPVKSLVRNIGTDGSGTHMRKTFRYTAQMIDSFDNLNFCPPDEKNINIDRKFRMFHNVSPFRAVINYLIINKYRVFSC